TYQCSSGSATFLNGTINNTGTILEFNGPGNATELHISDGTTLTGGGSLIISGPRNSIFGAVNSGTETLTNVNNTISGEGNIGNSNSIEFINQSAGVINANDSNPLII